MKKNKLEEFVQQNKEGFDSYEPSEALWQRLEKKLPQANTKKSLVVQMSTKKWLAAAAVLACVIMSALYFFNSTKTITPPEIVKTNTPIVTPSPQKEIVDIDTLIKEQPSETLVKVENNKLIKPSTTTNDDVDDNTDNSELYHYTKLIQIKQQQLNTLKKDEPLLYQKFAQDFNQLEKSFTQLKKQAAENNTNSEQLLEAMISNLQLQSALLNKQLQIIKNIKNTKKARYEKVYNDRI